jgi:hypothetical protein
LRGRPITRQVGVAEEGDRGFDGGITIHGGLAVLLRLARPSHFFDNCQLPPRSNGAHRAGKEAAGPGRLLPSQREEDEPCR